MVTKYDLMRAEGVNVEAVKEFDRLYGADYRKAVKGVKKVFNLTKEVKTK